MAKKIETSEHSTCSHSDSAVLPPITTTKDSQASFIETINFDDTAKQMAKLKAIIFDAPDTTQTKIQFIKEELATDRYQIHSSHIASKLMEYAELMEEAEIA